MRGPNSTEVFKQGFLKNLILKLGACSTSSSGITMSLQERKRAIKSSADMAMATARGAGARWPHALLASSTSSRPPPCKEQWCKKILKRCHQRTRRRNGGTRRRNGGTCSSHAKTARVSSREMARRLVRKRTKVLRKMIPGGELLLNEATLLREAMDYVAHLHAQVDVLRRISKAVG
ncbi:hypothetical protein QOZ80_2AG0103610 [Eleusine coracana subsp. coracana]|nr:hypothetical protein QOZ80_2AG0103610 [Eleusine coracana subsp. coracana]